MNVVGNALTELYRIFSVMNDDKFDGALPEPVITIQKTRGLVLGHFTIDKVWRNKNNVEEGVIVADNQDDTAMYEINIDPRWFSVRTTVEIVGTLLHEMCHYYNKMCDIKDCSGNVHNKKFKACAENVGLIVTKEKSVGYGLTEVSEELCEYIEETINPDDSVFEYFRAGVLKEDNLGKKRKKTLFKFTCPDCGAVAKAKKGVSIKCSDCNVDFEIEEDEESDNSEE